MIKCPFCHFMNEDGALFCEQCKSDLSSVAAPAAASPPPPMAMAEPIPALAEPIPLAADPIALAEPIPLAAEPVAEAVVAEAVVAEAVPLEPAHEPPPPLPLAELEPPPAHAHEPVHAAAAESTAPAPAPEPPPPPAPAAAAPAPAPAPAADGGPALPLPSGAQPRLIVLRGQKRSAEYPIYEGLNFIGRADDKPVDIDLEDQEPPDRVWCSRQHACISFETSLLSIEDLNSSNGTYVNRTRVYPGQKRPLNPNDVIQIGNVQLKVVV
jgi:FHA domain